MILPFTNPHSHDTNIAHYLYFAGILRMDEYYLHLQLYTGEPSSSAGSYTSFMSAKCYIPVNKNVDKDDPLLWVPGKNTMVYQCKSGNK